MKKQLRTNQMKIFGSRKFIIWNLKLSKFLRLSRLGVVVVGGIQLALPF